MLQHAGCVRLACSVAVTHERHERLDATRLPDRGLVGIVTVRQIQQRDGCTRLASSIAFAYEHYERPDAARGPDHHLVGIVTVRQIPQRAGCVRLACSVAVAHERQESIDSARSPDSHLVGIVTVRQIPQRGSCIRLAYSVTVAHERHERLDVIVVLIVKKALACLLGSGPGSGLWSRDWLGAAKQAAARLLVVVVAKERFDFWGKRRCRRFGGGGRGLGRQGRIVLVPRQAVGGGLWLGSGG